MTAVDVDHGRVQHYVKGSSADQYLFDGFTSFALDDDGKHLRGLTPHVTGAVVRLYTTVILSSSLSFSLLCVSLVLYATCSEDGYCDDGCFRFGTQSVLLGSFKGLYNDGLPYKAVMSDVSFLDRDALTYHAQGSYPLTPEVTFVSISAESKWMHSLFFFITC